MAFHRHLVQIPWDVASAGIAPRGLAKPPLGLEWHPDEAGRLRSRWTQARD